MKMVAVSRAAWWGGWKNSAYTLKENSEYKHHDFIGTKDSRVIIADFLNDIEKPQSKCTIYE